MALSSPRETSHGGSSTTILHSAGNLFCWHSGRKCGAGSLPAATGMIDDMRDARTGAVAQTSKLLWESCRRDPDAAAVRRALIDGADTGLAAAAATEHGIEPLLWRALGAAGVRDACGPERTALRAVANARRMEALLLIPPAVARAVQPLSDAGLMPLVFKGPAVADRYPEPGLRPMGDIDLLLPPADHGHALEVLRRARWRVVRPGSAGHYDTVLVHDQVPSLFLEVHFGLEPRLGGSDRARPGGVVGAASAHGLCRHAGVRTLAG